MAINDKRTNPVKYPVGGFMVYTDKALSGWGLAQGGRSLYALQCDTVEAREIVATNGANRSEMKRGRWVRSLRNVRMGARDHMSIVDSVAASRWYEAGGFSK